MVLVDGVVAEVHARVPQILPSVIVLHCREPGKMHCIYLLQAAGAWDIIVINPQYPQKMFIIIQT